VTAKLTKVNNNAGAAYDSPKTTFKIHLSIFPNPKGQKFNLRSHHGGRGGEAGAGGGGNPNQAKSGGRAFHYCFSVQYLLSQTSGPRPPKFSKGIPQIGCRTTIAKKKYYFTENFLKYILKYLLVTFFLAIYFTNFFHENAERSA
jgi:hypothetical protein